VYQRQPRGQGTIYGAGGGIGGFAVQLAKHVGAELIATASWRSAAAVQRFGADRLIDYTATPVADALDEPVDTVINLVAISPKDAVALVPLVRAGGVIVSVATPVEPPPGALLTAEQIVARNDVTHLAALIELIDAGDLTVEVTETLPLSDLGHVHRRSEAGETHGKIIIVPRFDRAAQIGRGPRHHDPTEQPHSMRFRQEIRSCDRSHVVAHWVPGCARNGRCLARACSRRHAPCRASRRLPSAGLDQRPLPLAREVVVGTAPKRENRAAARFPKPSDGLEPSTPSLPWKCSTN
jgi:hypothetical protein